MGETEDEEVAGGRAPAEGAGDRVELGRGHVGCGGVGNGSVVEEGVGDGGRERGVGSEAEIWVVRDWWVCGNGGVDESESEG